MRTLLRYGPFVLVAVLVVAVVVAWARPTPELEADDAAAVAIGAISSLDLESVVDVEAGPILGPDDEWVVQLGVGEHTIEVRVPPTVGELSYVDDNIGPAAAPTQLFSDDQIAALDRYRDDEVADDRTRQNAVGSAGAVAVLVVIGLLAWRSRRADTDAPAPATTTEGTAP